ncbi:MAG: hypothetical protein CSA50_03640 [Gammaproteobacteria bacterium]|nr:MAG: hypothetical protein CSA50_03640 [Gammaproteobacteria bacterium]
MDYDGAYHKLFSNPELIADLFSSRPATQLALPLEQTESLNEEHYTLSNRIEEWQQNWRQD